MNVIDRDLLKPNTRVRVRDITKGVTFTGCIGDHKGVFIKGFSKAIRLTDGIEWPDDALVNNFEAREAEVHLLAKK